MSALLLRHHFKLNGRPKAALTQAQAQALAIKHHKRAYHCDFCGHWHIGGRS